MAVYNYATISSHIQSEFILPLYVALFETIPASSHKSYIGTSICKYLGSGTKRIRSALPSAVYCAPVIALRVCVGRPVSKECFVVGEHARTPATTTTTELFMSRYREVRMGWRSLMICLKIGLWGILDQEKTLERDNLTLNLLAPTTVGARINP